MFHGAMPTVSDKARYRRITLVLLISPIVFDLGLNLLEGSNRRQLDDGPTIYSEAPGKVAVITGESLAYNTPLLQVQRLLEHQGLVYDVVKDRDFTVAKSKEYFSAIVVGGSQPTSLSGTAIEELTNGGAGIIWIEDMPSHLSPLFGIRTVPETESHQTINRIDYGEFTTRIFNEAIYPIEPLEAHVNGWFMDNADRRVSPAETSYRSQNTSGIVYYFAYDACSWWGVDPEYPWARAYRLQMALNNILSGHLTVSLAPYPRNLKTAFITRIEDVDPLHNSYEWIMRAYSYLEYYTSRNALLSVSLTPTYIDPSVGLDIGLEAVESDVLRKWLSHVLLSGGTVIEHGFTHQYNGKKTGVAPEFYNEEKREWLSLNEQKQRISAGANQIRSNLGFSVKGFEAPHYLANKDTYAALSQLGFRYITHNSDTPFLDRIGLAEGLVNIPETLGYIPLDSTKELEETMKANIDMLYNMSCVILFFNHLYEDESLKIGEHLLEYSLTKPMVWYTNTDNLAEFWHERLNAYDKMDVKLGRDIEVTLGPTRKAGLTIVLPEEKSIRRVHVNGALWPTFRDNYVILPVLRETANSILISLSEDEPNTNMPQGLTLVILSTALSILLFKKTTSTHHVNRTQG